MLGVNEVSVVVSTVLFAWLLGSAPLGAWWIRRATGRDARNVSPGLLGVENVFRLLGPHVAAVSFGLDVVKGALAVLLLPQATLAAVFVLAGHVWPFPWRVGSRSPRGRGNGVLLGAVLALLQVGVLPVAAVLTAAAGFAAVLARWGYATTATLAGLAVLLAWPSSVTWLAAAWLAIVTLRGIPALMRMADGTEPRIGDPPPVQGVSEGRLRAAFMIHPMTLDDVWQVPSQGWVYALYRRGWLSEAALRRVLPWLRPQLHGILRGVDLPDGRTLDVALIGGPMLPDQIRGEPEAATTMAIRGAKLAQELGAVAFGLGAYWSTVGEKGRLVQEAVPDLPVTHGGSYTAATVQAAIPRLLARYGYAGGRLSDATAAVVGANGVVAFGVARALVPHVARLVLIGTDEDRLERSARTLRRKAEGCEVVTSTDVSDVAEAELVFTATSAPGYVVRSEHVRPGAWIYDLGRPADVDPAVRDVPGVQLIPGGVVRPPGSSVSDLDLHFGEGRVPACLAETMILAATGERERATTGGTARSQDVAWFLEQGERLGFDIVLDDEDAAEAPASSGSWERSS